VLCVGSWWGRGSVREDLRHSPPSTARHTHKTTQDHTPSYTAAARPAHPTQQDMPVTQDNVVLGGVGLVCILGGVLAFKKKATTPFKVPPPPSFVLG
jgi:hypothetical protein